MKNFESNNTFKTIDDIMEYFYSKVINSYFPGILNEGDLFREGKELYIKIIVVKKGVIINKTWMKDNLSMGDDDGIFNLIVTYNYKHKSIYGINPLMLFDKRISLVEQDNLDVLAMDYDDGSKNVNMPLLVFKKDDDIMLFTQSIKDYVSPNYGSCDWELYAEVEYRVYNDNLNPNRVGTFEDKNTYIDLLYRADDSSISKSKIKQYWLRFTKKIDIVRLFNNVKEAELKIQVVDFASHEIRNLNQMNYNDDIDAGLVIFSKEAADIIKQYYYFYDLTLEPKKDGISSSIVDYFDDIIVFWEGEFNSKLPLDLKQKIQKYNITDRKDNIISTAMFNWQMQCQWEVFDDLYPNQQLARIVVRKKFELAKDLNLDFYPPKSIEEYSIFVKKIFSLFELDVKKLRLYKEHEEKLLKVINSENIFTSNEDMVNNYYGFCYLIVQVIGYEKE